MRYVIREQIVADVDVEFDISPDDTSPQAMTVTDRGDNATYHGRRYLVRWVERMPFRYTQEYL